MIDTVVVLGTILNPVSDERVDLYPRGALVMKSMGCGRGYRVAALEDRKTVENKYLRHGQTPVLDFSKKVILPSFFDVHFHWVQDEVCLKPKENLLEWLSNHAWPHEARFKSRLFSVERAKDFAKKLAQVGTLGGAVYGSLHPHTVDLAHELFVGDFVVGNVLMDINAPVGLRHKTERALAEISALSERYRAKYAVTPRFAITTSSALMDKGAEIARANRSFIQTHLSETRQEIAQVLELYRSQHGFSDVESVTEIYDRVGLLSARTIMGHALHLSDSELALLRKKNTSIAHCPTSNAPIDEMGLGSGLFDFKRAEQHGVNWALASDIGGGPFLSMFDVMRSFVLQNRRSGHCEATYTKALFRATLKGAELLKLHRDTGNLSVGKWANFLVVEPGPNPDAQPEQILEGIMSPLREDRAHSLSMVAKTYYRGREVYPRSALR